MSKAYSLKQQNSKHALYPVEEEQKTLPVSQFLVQKQFAVKSADYTAIGMDYCPGGELFMYLKVKKRFSVGEAQFYAASILQGLEALHMANIVYRE